MKRFRIYDWAGNEMTAYGTFDTFEDAWDCVFEHFEDDEDRGEFQVLEDSESAKYGR